MIDIKRLLDEPELVTKNNEHRGKTIDIQVAIGLHEQRLSLVEDVQSLRTRANEIAGKIPSVSSDDERRGLIEEGKTYCMLGSSGVGKSTLLNNLSGKNIMKTDQISQSTNKGRHVTSHRELVVLENGGIIIDNPGMREVGVADSSGDAENIPDMIASLSRNCKFNDCTHTNETGCSVLDALEKGELDKDSYENYLKMERERSYFESTVVERRRKDKEFGKLVKNYKKGKNKNH